MIVYLCVQKVTWIIAIPLVPNFNISQWGLQAIYYIEHIRFTTHGDEMETY